MLRRVLVKLSGEALGPAGIRGESLSRWAAEISGAAQTGCSMGIVLGGGNLLRGREAHLPMVRREVVDRIGMLATIMNSLALAEALRSAGVRAEVLSSTSLPGVADLFRMERARELLDAGTVLLLAGGTGHPYFTTDSAAALRALEIGAEALLKGTKVDGVYSADPVDNPEAARYDSLSYDRVLELGLEVMDLTSITLCREHDLPIHVFDAGVSGNLRRLIEGEDVGTRIGPEG